jgi:iron complex outermembrane receptor protein
MKRMFVAALLMAVPCVVARAQADTGATLPPVSVTASRSGIPLFSTPLAVTRLTPADWRGLGGYGLDDAIAGVPGVVAQSRYGTSDVRLTIRGFGSRGAGDRSNSGTSRGIRVLLNGVPETEPDGRTAFDNVDLSITTGIDVVRSNASASWGNAAGGVVNISTIPEYTEPFVEQFNAIGGFGLQRFGARGGTLFGDARAFGSVVNSSFAGWRANSASSRTTFDGGIVAPLGDRTVFRTLLNASLNRFHIPGPLTREQMDADPTQANATYLARRERRDNKLGRVALALDHQVGDAQGFSAMLFAQPKYLQRSERGTYRDFNRYHIGGNALYRAAGRLGEHARGTFSVGTDVAYQDGTILFYSLSATQDRGATLQQNKREGANNFGVFVSEDIEIGDRWVLDVGARWDAITYSYSDNITPSANTTKSFTRTTPKLGLTFKPSAAHSWYVSIGGGVEAPAGNETDPEAGTPNAVFAINPLLDPIVSTTYEAGTRRTWAPSAADAFVRSVQYDVAAFFTTVTNEIVPYNGGRFYFTAGEAERKGVEVGTTITARGGWSLKGSVTLMDATYASYVVDSVHYGKSGAVADYSGNQIVGIPQATFHSTLGWAPAALRGVQLQAGVHHIGSYVVDDANTIDVPSSTVLNAGIVGTRPWSLGNGFGVRGSVMVTNLTDARYVGSAYLNPDKITVNGTQVPAVYEPGLPRQVIVSLSVGSAK